MSEGYQRTVARIVDAPPAEPPVLAAAENATPQAALKLGDLQTWWVDWMVMTPTPAAEALTLFWHGHFTSDYRKVARIIELRPRAPVQRGGAPSPTGGEGTGDRDAGADAVAHGIPDAVTITVADSIPDRRTDTSGGRGREALGHARAHGAHAKPDAAADPAPDDRPDIRCENDRCAQGHADA